LPGSIVICERAIRDEGTSYHYLSADKYVHADPALVDRLRRALEARGNSFTVGTTWTTDAPYRETREEVRQYQSEGVKTVEMETAALLALGQVRGAQTASVCVVGDSLAAMHWETPPDVRSVEKGLEAVYAAAIEALSSE
jgi:uridine phosphorylase